MSMTMTMTMMILTKKNNKLKDNFENNRKKWSKGFVFLLPVLTNIIVSVKRGKRALSHLIQRLLRDHKFILSLTS